MDIIPDIILTDVMMPVMDGFQMIKELRKDMRTDHIPIIVLTARGDLDSRIEGLGDGADHYLVKPFEVEELLLTLQNVLTARKKLQDKVCSPVNHKHPTGVRYRRGIEFVGKVHAILDEHLSVPDFDISDICDALHMSRAQFYRKFSAVTSNSIGKYLRSYRLHKAKAILENSSGNVTEAALSTGFRNASHFSTAFKQEFGSPPSNLLRTP